MRWIENEPIDERAPVWTRANVGEVLPDPPTPLTWDLVWTKGGTRAGWWDCSVHRLGMGADELGDDPSACPMIGVHGGYAYLNASWNRIWGERVPGMGAAAIDAAYFGARDGVPTFVPEPWHRREATTAVVTGWLGWVMGTMQQDELEADRAESLRIRANRPDFSSLADRALVGHCRSLRTFFRRCFDQHINQTAASSIGPGAIGAICAALGRPGDTLTLIAGLGGVDSAAPSQALWSLGRIVAGSPVLTTLFDGGVTGLPERLEAAAGDPSVDEFTRGFTAFIGEFGSRGPNEWELMAETWETAPTLALALVDRMRVTPEDGAPALHEEQYAARREAVASEIDAMLSADPATQAQFRAALASAATFVPGRERSKTTIIRAIGESRLALRELGRRFVERGVIASPPELCLLFEDELDAVIAGKLEAAAAAAMVCERREHHARLRTLEPPFIVETPDPDPNSWPRRDAVVHTSVQAGDRLRGMPGCPGVVRARARVVEDPSDPGALEPGEILVAPMTDPAWTPLFVPAAGVVVDVGAALSHAIIVSRELGIPCVVSVTDASHRIPNGALVELDGAAGTVTVVEVP